MLNVFFDRLTLLIGRRTHLYLCQPCPYPCQLHRIRVRVPSLFHKSTTGGRRDTTTSTSPGTTTYADVSSRGKGRHNGEGPWEEGRESKCSGFRCLGTVRVPKGRTTGSQNAWKNFWYRATLFKWTIILGQSTLSWKQWRLLKLWKKLQKNFYYKFWLS